MPKTADERTQRLRLTSALLNIPILVFLILTILLLCLHFVSFAKAKTLFDSYLAVHVSGDGKSYLAEQDYDRLILRLPLAASIFGFCGVALILFRHKLAGFLVGIPTEWAEIHISLFNELRKNIEARLELGAVLIVTTVGVWLRVWHLKRPVRFDEAWTYLEFASKPLIRGLSNYRAPNNHLLNTLLVHFSTKLFGNSIFGLRLPALVAGCLVIIATWLVTRSLYGRYAGLLSAGCIAVLPTFIEFSVNARGYALQWLSVLGMIWLGFVLQEKPFLKIGWLAFVLTAVMGMYSIPTTLFPIAGIFAWMLVSTGFDGTISDLKNMSKRVVLAGLAIGILSTLLYIPPILARGVGAVTANEVVTWQQPEFVRGLQNMIQCARVQWAEGVPGGILVILCLGFAFGLLLHRKISTGRLSRDPLSITVALWIPAVIFIWVRHVFAFPRVWSYLLLSAVMTASAGLSLVVGYLGRRSRYGQVVIAGVASIGLAAVTGAGVIKDGSLFTTNETGTIIDADQIVDFLSADLHSGDSLISNAIIQYDLLQRHSQLYKSLAGPKEGSHLVAVVVKSTSVIEVCKADELRTQMAAKDIADPSALAAQIDFKAYTTPRVLSKFVTSTVYALDRKEPE